MVIKAGRRSSFEEGVGLRKSGTIGGEGGRKIEKNGGVRGMRAVPCPLLWSLYTGRNLHISASDTVVEGSGCLLRLNAWYQNANWCIHSN